MKRASQEISFTPVTRHDSHEKNKCTGLTLNNQPPINIDRKAQVFSRPLLSKPTLHPPHIRKSPCLFSIRPILVILQGKTLYTNLPLYIPLAEGGQIYLLASRGQLSIYLGSRYTNLILSFCKASVISSSSCDELSPPQHDMIGHSL